MPDFFKTFALFSRFIPDFLRFPNFFQFYRLSRNPVFCLLKVIWALRTCKMTSVSTAFAADTKIIG